MVLSKIKTIRFNDATLEKVKLIQKTDPENYKDLSKIVRAGVHYLYNHKLIGGSKKNELLQN